MIKKQLNINYVITCSDSQLSVIHSMNLLAIYSFMLLTILPFSIFQPRAAQPLKPHYHSSSTLKSCGKRRSRSSPDHRQYQSTTNQPQSRKNSSSNHGAIGDESFEDEDDDDEGGFKRASKERRSAGTLSQGEVPYVRNVYFKYPLKTAS